MLLATAMRVPPDAGPETVWRHALESRRTEEALNALRMVSIGEIDETVVPVH